MSFLGIDKLIEVCAQGVGAIAKPWMIKRIAKAEAEKLKILAAAQQEIDERKALLNQPLLLGPGEPLELAMEDPAARIAARIEYREGRRQLNVESIALGAADALAEESTVSTEPVDDDWIARFFSAAQEVSNRDLQTLWSRLLAREIAAPGAVPLRTVDVLKNLSPDEGRLFAQMLAHVCSDSTGSVHFFPAVPTFTRYAHVLDEAGLIGASIRWGSKTETDAFIWRHAGLELRFAARKEKTGLGFAWSADAYPMTSAGESIVRVSKLQTRPSRPMFVELESQLSRYLDIQVMVGDDAMLIADFIAAVDKEATERE